MEGVVNFDGLLTGDVKQQGNLLSVRSVDGSVAIINISSRCLKHLQFSAVLPAKCNGSEAFSLSMFSERYTASPGLGTKKILGLADPTFDTPAPRIALRQTCIVDEQRLVYS